MAEYTLEQRIFLYDTYVKYSSARRCRREFQQRFAGVRIPSRSTIHDLVNKVRRTGSFLNKKHVRQRRVLTEEKLDEVGARLEHTPQKSLRRLAQEVNISKSAAFVATKLLKLKPYKVTVVHALQPQDPVSRVNYCNWFLQSVHNGEVDPLLTFFTDEAWFYLQGHVSTQNNRYWATENPHMIHEVPHHAAKVGVWCAVSALRIIGPIFYDTTVDSHVYVNSILNNFFPLLTRNERLCGWFQQDSATAHTAENSMHELRSVYGDRIISRGLWPPRSPDLSPCDFYLWGTLKNKVYASNPHTLQELKDSITREIQAISQHELLRVNQNCFRRYRECVRVQGHQFQHLL